MKDPIKFGTDGIRGIAGEYPLDPISVVRIGRAIGCWLYETELLSVLKRSVLIGWDTRASADMIGLGLTTGLMAEGVHVDLGDVRTTPEIAFLARAYQTIGIMVTASHNPYDQNGIKLFGLDGFKLTDAQEESIEHLITTYTPESLRTTRLGTYANDDVGEDYVDDLVRLFSDKRLENLTIVADCANGAAYQHVPEILHQVKIKSFVMNAAPDGLNINVNAGSEYVRRDRSALLAAIKAHNADLGIAFDGDADRVVFVTPDGMLIDGDHILGILAVQMQAEGKLPHDTIVATDMSNSGLEHFLRAHGIRLARTKVGDRYVMERLREGGLALGGEQAGHVIILDGRRTAGDGIYVGLLVAAMVAKNKREGGPTLSELAKQIPRYPQVIASAHLASRVDLKSVPGLADLTEQTLAAFEGKGRVNLRFSGTEPNLLRAMVEGGPGNNLDDVVGRALALCRSVAAQTEKPDPRIDIVDCVTGAPVQISSQ